MDDENDLWGINDTEGDEDELFDDPYEAEEPAAVQKQRTLRQMEEDCEAAGAEIDRLLGEDPNTPTEVLLGALRQRVKPLAEYRPTQEEINALRVADIMHSLRGGKRKKKEENDELDVD
jgi:hypothetical protein